jgi:hypothetical protein
MIISFGPDLPHCDAIQSMGKHDGCRPEERRDE